MKRVQPCNCNFSMFLHGETRNCMLNGSIVLLLLFAVPQIQKEHLGIEVMVYCSSCISQIRSKHKGSWDLIRQASRRSIVGVFWPAQFSLCASSFWEFILFFLLLSLLLGDGSAGRRCLQRLWPQWVFCRLLPYHWMPCLRAASSSAPCLAIWCKFYLALQVSLPILLGKVLSCPGPTALAPQVPPQYQTQVSWYVFILSKAVRHHRLL